MFDEKMEERQLGQRDQKKYKRERENWEGREERKQKMEKRGKGPSHNKDMNYIHSSPHTSFHYSMF